MIREKILAWLLRSPGNKKIIVDLVINSKEYKNFVLEVQEEVGHLNNQIQMLDSDLFADAINAELEELSTKIKNMEKDINDLWYMEAKDEWACAT